MEDRAAYEAAQLQSLIDDLRDEVSALKGEVNAKTEILEMVHEILEMVQRESSALVTENERFRVALQRIADASWVSVESSIDFLEIGERMRDTARRALGSK